MKETILVTGGTGFIGSHTTVELQQAGYDVVIVDNLSNSREDVLDGIEKITGIRPAFEKVDLRDFDATESVFKKYPKISGIIHFAASKAVGESVQKPLLYYHNNIVSLINLLQLMPKYDVKGIIFSSSCTVYGQPDVLPATEETPIKKAESPDDYDTPDGSCIRDYIYVVDLAKAHVCAMTRIMEDQTTEPVEVYNIGTGTGTSVLELINAFEKATGVKLNYKIVGRRAGDIEKVWGNVDKANKVLGWKAETPLEDVLASAWKWQCVLREKGIM